jgi:hypothetical protein
MSTNTTTLADIAALRRIAGDLSALTGGATTVATLAADRAAYLAARRAEANLAAAEAAYQAANPPAPFDPRATHARHRAENSAWWQSLTPAMQAEQIRIHG